MKTPKWITTGVCSGMLLSPLAMAASVATDNASNAPYADNSFDGDNGGSGFGSWSVSTSGGGGSYAGGTGQGDPAFGVFSTDSGSSVASRSLTNGALLAGQTFSIDLGHTVTINNGGEVGINLTDGGAAVMTLKFVGGQSSWQLNDGGSDFGAGQNYAANTSLTFSFTYEGGNDYSYTFGTGSGSDFTASNTISGIDGFEIFSNNQGNDQNLGANNISVVPEPSIALIGALGLLGILRRRKA